MARKSTAKAEARQAALKVVGAGAELREFRKVATVYREADEHVKLYTKQRDAVKSQIKSFVNGNGDKSPKSETLTFVDAGVKWMLTARAGYDADSGVVALLEAIKTAKGKRKQLLAACIVTKPTIDNEAWARAKAEGVVSEELRETYETGLIQSLKWSYSDKARCPGCDSVVTRTSKFCSECGASVTST